LQKTTSTIYMRCILTMIPIIATSDYGSEMGLYEITQPPRSLKLMQLPRSSIKLSYFQLA